MTAIADPYASAKANLRDNVKTLITLFGGVTALLLAGTPFSGFAGLKLFGTAWFIAAAGLIAALTLLTFAVRTLMFVLRPDLTSISHLQETRPDDEIKELQTEFNNQKMSLLPRGSFGAQAPKIEDVDGLISATQKADQEYFDAQKKGNLDDKDLAAYKERSERLHEYIGMITHWAGLMRLHIRVRHGVDTVMWLGLAAVVAIAIFVIASNSPEKESAKGEAASVYVVVPSSGELPQPQAPPLPSMPAVRFATGMDTLSKEEVGHVEAARNYLRSNPQVGILIFANTDTVGGERLNESLAVRRAQRVASLLRSEGGISPSRIFVTPLAKRDLPKLTEQKADQQENRAVEMILIPLPVRR